MGFKNLTEQIMLKNTICFFLIFGNLLFQNTLVEAISGKIQPEVFKKLKHGHTANIMVEVSDTAKGESINMEAVNTLDEIARVAASPETPAHEDKLTALVNTYQAEEIEALDPVIQTLESWEADFDILWVTRMLCVEHATLDMVEALAEIDSVQNIRLEREFFPNYYPHSPPHKPRAPPTGNSTWNIGLIDARCKDITCLGSGVRIGSIDSGVLWNHVELVDNWIGEPYGWWDGFSPVVSPFPVDVFGHGTHTVGTACGKTVGVAPHAQWLACNVDNGECFPESAILICSQFMACPWMWNDTSREKSTKNCSLRAHVINNSWGGDGVSQILDPRGPFLGTMYRMIEFWNALGIISPFAQGNAGPSCGSSGEPGSYDIVLGVGAVDNTATIAYFSARGPVIVNSDQLSSNTTTAVGSCKKAPFYGKCSNKSLNSHKICTLIKPDIVAPGVNINSSFNTDTTSYVSWMGTSMATPHITGVVALMMCANPDAKWNYKLVHKILTETADTSWIDLKAESPSNRNTFAESSNILCNFIVGGMCDKYPNHLYGHGLVDACSAVKKSKDLAKQASLKVIFSCMFIDPRRTVFDNDMMA